MSRSNAPGAVDSEPRNFSRRGAGRQPAVETYRAKVGYRGHDFGRKFSECRKSRVDLVARGVEADALECDLAGVGIGDAVDKSVTHDPCVAAGQSYIELVDGDRVGSPGYVGLDLYRGGEAAQGREQRREVGEIYP